MSLQQDIRQLLAAQKEDWTLARNNFDALNHIEVKIFDFDGYIIKAQFNPTRAVSSLAKVDKKSIEKRPCFLCASNRPKEQKDIEFLNKYDILINPFPIFPEHFTIPCKNHSPQQLTQERLLDMLNLSAELPDFTIFYNGPQAGASAPDHFHLQAGNKDFFSQEVSASTNGLISKKVLTSKDKSKIWTWVNDFLRDNKTSDEEPMLNLFCQKESESWTLTLFPRKVHRPTQYASGELMLSPGAVDMAGVLIVARKEDFDKLNKEIIKDVFRQVSKF